MGKVQTVKFIALADATFPVSDGCIDIRHTAVGTDRGAVNARDWGYCDMMLSRQKIVSTTQPIRAKIAASDKPAAVLAG